MLRKLCVLSSLFLAFILSAFAQDSRHFTFHYAFTVKNLPAAKRIRIWIPAAQSDAYQEVRVVSAKEDLPAKTKREAKYGNLVYFAEVSTSQQPELHFDIEYDVLRRERIGLRNAAHLAPASLSTEEGQKDLQPDVLVPTSGPPADLAAKVRQGKLQLLEKARAIFDYVFAAMHYDKTGTGWGRGDVLYACDGQEGQLKQSSEIAGYHCWSDFYVDGKGWIPVDISEAWKHQERRDYFYGSHDVNRIQFSMGRDLRLNLLQDGKPLSYFVYPYVEVDGQEYPNVSLAFSFADAVMAVAAKKIGVH